MEIKKEKEVLTTVHKQTDSSIRKVGDSKIKSGLGTTRTKEVSSIAGRMAQDTMTNHVEGGENIDLALDIAKEGARKGKNAIGSGNRIRKEVKKAKSVNKRIEKEVVSKQPGRTLRKKTRKQAKKQGRKMTEKSAKKAAKKIAKETGKTIAKETAKEVAKETTKVAAEVGSTTAGSVAGPYGLIIGAAVGEAVGQAIEVKAYSVTQKMRLLKFFKDKTGDPSNSSDSLGKLIIDLIKNRLLFQFKMMARNLFLALGPIVLPTLIIVITVVATVMGIIAVLYNSPFAIFLPPLESGETVYTVSRQYMDDFNQEIQSLADNGVNSQIIYADYEGMDEAPSNYYDILCVYMTKYGFKSMATQMNDTNKRSLKEVFNEMCSYTTATVQDEPPEKNNTSTKPSQSTEVVGGSTAPEQEGGVAEENKPKNEQTTTETQSTYHLEIRVTLKNYYQMIGTYNFSNDEVEVMKQVMDQFIASGELDNTQLTDLQSSLSEEEIKAITDKITNQKQKKVVSFALSKVGYPYSNSLRDSGAAYDCSSLAYYAWKAAGVDISNSGSTTAAAEAEGLKDNLVTNGQLKPGDLVFYSYTTNGRYKNISHVGIYIGDGKMVEAVDPAHGVCMGNYHTANIVMICRPK